jgi:hypothetical protein
MKRPILMLLPSLGRKGLGEAVNSLVHNGTGLADVIVITGPGGFIGLVNDLPREFIARYDIVGFMGDDGMMRTKDWDRIVCEKLKDKRGLIYGRDGHHDQRLCTHPFVSTACLLALGFVQPPELHHYYGDNYYQELFTALGRIEYVPELFIEHLHPDTGKVPNDASYNLSREWWDRDSAAWSLYQRTRLPEDIARLREVL